MQLVGSLYLLYFPYCGLILWEVCDVGDRQYLYNHTKLASLASLLLACSPPINGLLYGLKSQTLRRSVQNYWRKKATKSELQQVIENFPSNNVFRKDHFLCFSSSSFFTIFEGRSRNASNLRRSKRGHRARRDREDRPEAEPALSSLSRRCSEGWARRCSRWDPAERGTASTAIISAFIEPGCNPPPRAIPFVSQLPNQVIYYYQVWTTGLLFLIVNTVIINGYDLRWHRREQ